MMSRPRIDPRLWFDHEAEEAANFQVSFLEGSRVDRTTPFGEGGMGPPGSVMLVEFTRAGVGFQDLDGGPISRFCAAVCLSVDCDSQAEVDRLWYALGSGGEPGTHGWLKDRYRLSCRIVPQALKRIMHDVDSARVRRVVSSMPTMTRLNIAAREQAFAG